MFLVRAGFNTRHFRKLPGVLLLMSFFFEDLHSLMNFCYYSILNILEGLFSPSVPRPHVVAIHPCKQHTSCTFTQVKFRVQYFSCGRSPFGVFWSPVRLSELGFCSHLLRLYSYTNPKNTNSEMVVLYDTHFHDFRH